ncbi:unnamed protein product [Linum trigynum]|uniref:Uncharacterized protein n=1 Tax=Linum trigynum TaxID=586398 RepID=A0AAV2DEW4_9ROSI
MVVSFFTTGTLPEAVTESTLVLIPKVDSPERVTQLRPISLNNVCLKSITKAITSRLKPPMRKLVSPRHSSFIPGRQTTDNIIVVQEVLHTLRKRRGKKGGMIFKIDLEKAYDMLRWDFVRDTLKEVGLPSSWITCIMYCVEHNTMRIRWNGELSQPITPSRGVRQGDPLSPYLFVLCMERLSHRIDEAVSNGQWKPVRLTNAGPPLTHLFFADDLLLFAEAEKRQIRVIKQCLEDFCYSSGQRINFSKSILYVSPNVARHKAEDLSTCSGIPLKAALGRYLGIQAIQERVTRGIYQSLILRIQRKMAPWKAKRLSFAARLTVAKSVTASLPVYTMHTELIPSGVCRNIDKITRDFVWGAEENRSKLHLVAWERLTLAKDQGGVGLRPTRQANLAMLAKSAWRLLQEKDNLWRQLLLSKYGGQRTGLDVLRKNQGSSFTWSSFSKAADLLKQGCAWNIKNGKKTKFWCDPWILQVPLKEVMTGDLSGEAEEAVVADFVRDDGSWRTELFSNLLQPDICAKITSTAVDKISQEEDTLFWSPSADGRFSTKSAYELLSLQDQQPRDGIWKAIWRLPVPERIRGFVWLAIQGRIATNVLHFQSKVAESPCCPRCEGRPETVLHIVRDCAPALYFWSRQVPQGKQQFFFSANHDEWFRSNLSSQETSTSGINWPGFFGMTIWLLWKNRTTAAFKGIGAALTAPSLMHSIITKSRIWNESWQAPELFLSHKKHKADRVIAAVGWTPPAEGWVMVNTDGASNGNPGPAGAGGVVRDTLGNWLGGFVANIGSATAALAELWAIFYGLELTWKLGFRVVKVATDSQLAIQLIQDRHDPIHPYATLLSLIRRKMGQDWLVSLTHTYLEGNRVADWLSKHSLVYPYGMYELADPPMDMVAILQDDARGTTFDRRIVVNHPPPI